jgi:polysaccharide pyruvyl transferase WcaK-like protein
MPEARRRLRRGIDALEARFGYELARAAVRRARPGSGPRDPVVLVRGYFGAGNLGDELLLEVLRRNFAERGLRLVAASLDPERTRREHGIEAVARTASPRDVVHLLPRLRRARLLLLGPGGILQSYGAPTSSLLAYALHAEAARRTRTPLGLLGVGAGPLPPAARRVAEGIVRGARAVLFRDAASRDLVAGGSGPADGVFVGPDLAFLHESGAGETPAAAGRNLGFAPIRLRNAAPGFAPADAARCRRELARGLADALPAGAALHPAVLHETEDRLELEAMRPDLERAGLVPLVPPPVTLAGTRAWLAGCEIVVVSRFHALVLALLQERPAVVLAYHPKVEALSRAAGLEAWTLSLRDLTAEGLAARIADARRRRAEITERMREFTAESRAAARAAWAAAVERLLEGPQP